MGYLPKQVTHFNFIDLRRYKTASLTISSKILTIKVIIKSRISSIEMPSLLFIAVRIIQTASNKTRRKILDAVNP